eukprot:1195588-Prorocentrum_minimum.AAC.12
MYQFQLSETRTAAEVHIKCESCGFPSARACTPRDNKSHKPSSNAFSTAPVQTLRDAPIQRSQCRQHLSKSKNAGLRREGVNGIKRAQFPNHERTAPQEPFRRGFSSLLY